MDVSEVETGFLFFNLANGAVKFLEYLHELFYLNGTVMLGGLQNLYCAHGGTISQNPL